MTLKEKVAEIMPEMVGEDYVGGVKNCPNSYNFLKGHYDIKEAEKMCLTSGFMCNRCWSAKYIEDNENALKVGDIAYILGRYTPDGDTKIVEIEIIKAWNNGKVLAYTTGTEPGEWKFYQSYLGKVVFRTREEAEKALKEEK